MLLIQVNPGGFSPNVDKSTYPEGTTYDTSTQDSPVGTRMEMQKEEKSEASFDEGGIPLGSGAGSGVTPSQMNTSPNPAPNGETSDTFRGTTLGTPVNPTMQAEEAEPSDDVQNMENNKDEGLDYSTGPGTQRIPRSQLDRP